MRSQTKSTPRPSQSEADYRGSQGSGPERPPFANRGVVQSQIGVLALVKQYVASERLGVGMAGIDFLTQTLRTTAGRALAERYQHLEDGTPRPGFRKSSKWVVPGGYAWRRTDPISRSKRFGKAYESWEASGAASQHLADVFKAYQGAPSRIDIAFDFRVPSELLADHVIEHQAEYLERRRLALGIAGQDGRNTRYVGSKDSERRIRIYRRDFKDPDLVREFGPLLRVELVLKKRQAKALWCEYRISRGQALAVAAAHVRDMLGLQLYGEWSEIPPLEAVPEQTRGAEMVYRFCAQNAVMLQAAKRLGIDVGALADLIATQKQGDAARKHQERLSARLRALAGVAMDQVRRIAAGGSGPERAAVGS